MLRKQQSTSELSGPSEGWEHADQSPDSRTCLRYFAFRHAEEGLPASARYSLRKNLEVKTFFESGPIQEKPSKNNFLVFDL